MNATDTDFCGTVKEKRWEFHKMGIDMSSAFDTIRRSVILELLADAGCSEDDIRLERYLLSNKTKDQDQQHHFFRI